MLYPIGQLLAKPRVAKLLLGSVKNWTKQLQGSDIFVLLNDITQNSFAPSFASQIWRIFFESWHFAMCICTHFLCTYECYASQTSILNNLMSSPLLWEWSAKLSIQVVNDTFFSCESRMSPLSKNVTSFVCLEWG